MSVGPLPATSESDPRELGEAVPRREQRIVVAEHVRPQDAGRNDRDHDHPEARALHSIAAPIRPTVSSAGDETASALPVTHGVAPDSADTAAAHDCDGDIQQEAQLAAPDGHGSAATRPRSEHDRVHPSGKAGGVRRKSPVVQIPASWNPSVAEQVAELGRGRLAR